MKDNSIVREETAKEYIERKQQEAFDKEFDELIKKNEEEARLQKEKQDYENEFISLVTKLSDYEDEIAILEEEYKSKVLNSDIENSYLENIVKDIKNLKAKYTTTKNKIDKFIKLEQL